MESVEPLVFAKGCLLRPAWDKAFYGEIWWYHEIVFAFLNPFALVGIIGILLGFVFGKWYIWLVSSLPFGMLAVHMWNQYFWHYSFHVVQIESGCGGEQWPAAVFLTALTLLCLTMCFRSRRILQNEDRTFDE